MSKQDNIEPPIANKAIGTLHPINQTKSYLLELLKNNGFQEIHAPERKWKLQFWYVEY